MTMTPDQIINELAQCIGSENYYQHRLGPIYTDGINYMATICEAYWLIDAIASYQTTRFAATNAFQVWELVKSPTDNRPDRHILTYEDGNGNLLIRQTIPFSDFPLEDIKIYVCDNTILLPSEY